ncbi:MAG: CarD family transcriptional regulator [Bullifex sp.]
MAANEMMFTVGQHVVYPQQGMGIIRSIDEKTHGDVRERYYSIYLKNADMNIMIPVNRAASIGIRNIVSAEEAMSAIDSIRGKAGSTQMDWKHRLQHSQELLNDGKISSIAKVVQTLYHRSKIKELPIQEKRIYEGALSLLIDEASLALSLDKEEISALILERLES